MEQNPTSPSKDQGKDKTEETKTQPNNAYNEQILEDPVDLRLGSSKMEFIWTSDPSDPEMTTALLPFEHTEKKLAEADDVKLHPQDAFTIQDSSEMSEPPYDTQPGPVVSHEMTHLLSFASLPYEISEDIPLVGEISVISRPASPVQGLAFSSVWPNETDLPVSTPDLAAAFLLPFSEDTKTDTTVPTESILNPDELMFLQPSFKPSVQTQQNDLGLLQISHPISEYPDCPQLLSKLTEWPSDDDLRTSGTVELDCSSFTISEPTEEAAVLPVKDSLTQLQLGPSELLHHTDLLSANAPELLPNSSQSPSLDTDWRSESVLREEQEIKFTERCPHPQQQLIRLPQVLQPQPFQLPPSMDNEPLLLLEAPTVSKHISTEAHPNACQQPIIFSGSNYIQPLPHHSSISLPPMPPFDAKHKQSDQLRSYFEPSLQTNNNLTSPFLSNRSFNLPSVQYDNWPGLVPQLNLSSISSVSQLNPDCLPQFPHADQHIPPPPFQINISSQLAHLNTGGTYSFGRVEQPSMVESISSRKNLSPKQYENYRLWQRYCKIAKSVYTSTPDIEALACFFIPVIQSFTLHYPGLPLHAAVKKAVMEWEKHSNFDRMGYYHMAHKFMEIEEEELKAEEPGTSKELTPRKQLSNQTNTLSAKVKGYSQFQSPYKMRGSGSRAQKSKRGSGAPRGGQAGKGKVQNLAEEAFKEYCEIMQGLESRINDRSEVMKEEEVVDDEDLEEGSFTEYLNELCSQKEFVRKVATEIDMAYVSSLLSSDLNVSDVLIQSEALGNAQDVVSCIPSEVEACNYGPQTTAGSSSLAAPEMHPPPQTYGTQSAPHFQPGLYTADGMIVPLLPSFGMPILLKQPKENYASDKNFLCSPQADTASHSGVCLCFQSFSPLNIFQMLPPPTGLQMFSDNRNAPQGIHVIPENCTLPYTRNFNTHNPFQHHNPFQQSLAPHLSQFGTNRSQNINCSLLPFSNNQMLGQMTDYNSQNALPHQISHSWSTTESCSVENTIKRTITLLDKKVRFYYRSSSHEGQVPNNPLAEENTLAYHLLDQVCEESQKVGMGAELQNNPQCTSHSNNKQQEACIRQKYHTCKKVIPPTIPCAVAESSTSETCYKRKSIKEKNKFVVGKHKIKESQPDKEKDHSGKEGKSNVASFLVRKEVATNMKTETAEGECSTSQTLPEDQDGQAGYLQEPSEPSEEELAVAQILALLSSPSYSSLNSPPSTRGSAVSPPVPLFNCEERMTPTEKLKICPIDTQEEETEGRLKNSQHSPLTLALLSLRALNISTNATSKLINKESDISEVVRWSLQSPYPVEVSHPHFENKMHLYCGNDTLKDELPMVSSVLAISEHQLSENMDLVDYLKGWSACNESNNFSSEGMLSTDTDVISEGTQGRAFQTKASEDKTKSNGDKVPVEDTSTPPEMIPQAVVVQLNEIQGVSQAQPGFIKAPETLELLDTPGQKDTFTGISTMVSDSHHLTSGHWAHVPTSEHNTTTVPAPTLDDTVIVTQNEFTKYNPIANNQADETRSPIFVSCNTQEKTEHLVNMLTDSTQGQLSPIGHLRSMSDWLDLDMYPEFPAMELDSTSGEADSMLATHLLLSLKNETCGNPLENRSTGTDSSPKDTTPDGTGKDPGRKETEVTKENVRSTDSKRSLTVEHTTIEEVLNEGSVTKGRESSMTQQIQIESPVCQSVENQENAAELTYKATETLSIDNKETVPTKPFLTLENEPITSEKFKGSLKNEETHMRQDELMEKRNECHLKNTTGVMEKTEQKDDMNLEVVSSILGKNSSMSSQITNTTSTIIDSVEEREQNTPAEYQAIEILDIQSNIPKKQMDKKQQNYDAPGSVTRQNLNEDEMQLAQKELSRKGRNARSCKIAEVRDILNESQRSLLNKVEWQTERQQQGLNKQYAMDTRNTRKSSDSPTSENAAETLNEQTKTEKTDINPNTAVNEVKKANLKTGGPLKTTSINARLTRDGNRCHGPSLEKEPARRPAQIEEDKWISDTPKRNKNFDDSERCGRSLRNNTSQLGIHFSLPVTSKAVTVNKRRTGQIKQTSIYEQGNTEINKNLRERQQTGSHMETLQGEGGEKELKALDRSSETTNSQTRKVMTGVENGVEEKQNKRVKREEDEKEDERRKGKDVEYRNVAATQKRETAMGNGFGRRKTQRPEERQRNEKRKEMEKSVSGVSHGTRGTENRHQCDWLFRGQKDQAPKKSAIMPEKSLDLVTPNTRQRAKRKNDGQEETKVTQKRAKSVSFSPPKKQNPAEIAMEGNDDGSKSQFGSVKLQNRTIPSVEVAGTPARPKTPVWITRGSLASGTVPGERKGEWKNSGSQKGAFRVSKGRQVEYRHRERKKKRSRLAVGDGTLQAKEKRATRKAKKLMNQDRKKKRIRERWSDRLGKMQKKRTR